MSSIRNDILSARTPESTLDKIYRAVVDDDHEIVTKELIELHNKKSVDLIDIYRHLKKKPDSGHNFFRTLHALEKALPELEVPTASAMQCVLHLYEEAGQDLASGGIISTFEKFCLKKPDRSSQALQIIEDNPSAFVTLLPATLAAGSEQDPKLYQGRTKQLLGHGNIEIQSAAVFAMGIIKWIDPEAALKSLEGIFERADDDGLLSRVLKAAYKLSQQDHNLLERSTTLINRVLDKGDEQTLHAAADLFWLQSNALQAQNSLLEIICRHLPQVKKKNSETINAIDHGLAEYFKHSPEESITLLESLLSALGGNSFSEHFENVAHHLLSDRTLLNQLATRWFLNGDPTFCQAIHHVVVTQSHGKDLVLSADSSEIASCNNISTIFLARKAIGYLLSNPVAAVSFVVSLMRIGPADNLPELSNLLLDPILLNYPGVVEDYLSDHVNECEDKIQSPINEAIANLEQYLVQLRSIGKLQELWPSNEQRIAHHRYYNNLMSESFKQAQGNSIFAQLFTRTVLLYGRSSITHVQGPNGTEHRTELPLQSHDVTITIPRIENIDPIGLDYSLRVFRQEQIK